MMRARDLALALLLVAETAGGTSCWLRGANDIEASINVEVLVSGLEDGDRILVDIDGDQSRHVFQRDRGRTLRLVAALDEGRHRLALVVERLPVRLCGERSFDVGIDGTSLSVDASELARCDDLDDDGGTIVVADGGMDGGDAGNDDAGEGDAGTDGGAPSDAGPTDGGDGDAGEDGGDGDEDGGDGDGDGDDDEDGGDGDGDGDGDGEEDGGASTLSFAFVREVITLPCGDAGQCDTITTTVDSEGDVTVSFDSSDEAVTGEASALDVAALAATLLSPAAAALFTGEDPTCPVDEPPPDVEIVRLERTLRVDDGVGGDEFVDDEVDVTACDGGVAAEIRARLALIRELVILAGD